MDSIIMSFIVFCLSFWARNKSSNVHALNRGGKGGGNFFIFFIRPRLVVVVVVKDLTAYSVSPPSLHRIRVCFTIRLEHSADLSEGLPNPCSCLGCYRRTGATL